MFRDHSLVPTEAIRLAALGMLAEEPLRYAELAGKIRHFTARIVGPSLELMGTSLELLRFEGLVEAAEGTGMVDNALLRLTGAGREALATLLAAGLRGPNGEINKLVLALKLRFLHLLPPAERAQQIDVIAEWLEAEIARLEDLRRGDADGSDLFLGWLDQDIAQARARLAWLAAQRDALAPAVSIGAARR
jgi:DNA-binding PadR family transcriptional regulator